MAKENVTRSVLLQTDKYDRASNKAHQLKILLNVMYGNGQEWFEDMGSKNRDTLLWIAADLAKDIESLIDSREVSHG